MFCYHAFWVCNNLRVYGAMAWLKGIAEWTEGNTAFISVVFSWDLQKAYQRAIWYKAMEYKVRVGGPAIWGSATKMFDGIAQAGGYIEDVVYRHNPDATFTTRGCPRNCPFCIVKKIEPEFVEFDEFPIRPIICDNNFLASSDYHFDMVCEKLSYLEGIDFNQGLDARLLTKEKARRLAKLNTRLLRLAFDSLDYENEFLTGFNMLIDEGIKAGHITVYVLINFRESMDDALYRLERVRELGAVPYPMRYQPVNARNKNKYLAKGWNKIKLKDIQRYYSRLNWLGHIPFEEYDHYKFKHSNRELI